MLGDDESARDTEQLELIQSHALQKLEQLPQTHRTSSVFYKTIEIITTCKDVIGVVIQSEPHAALAWAGVMTILPVSVGSSGGCLAGR